MHHRRPVFLNFTQIRLPITAVCSILHRLSGVLLFFSIPMLLCLLDCSLRSKTSFDHIITWLHRESVCIILWLIVSALFYHLVAGLRHMVHDMGWGESWILVRTTAWFVIILSIIFSSVLGWYLW